MKRRHQRQVLALPASVRADQIAWHPDQDEINWDRWVAAKREIELDAARERTEWLARQTERLAAIALQIEADTRRQQMADEMESRENWYREVNEREKDATTKLLAHFQSVMDHGEFERMKARVDAAAEDIRRQDCRLERLVLLKKGLVRGRRR